MKVRSVSRPGKGAGGASAHEQTVELEIVDRRAVLDSMAKAVGLLLNTFAVHSFPPVHCRE